MGSFADHWEDEILDHLFGKGSYTPPTIYVGLSTADPLDDASGLAEPVGANYSRVATVAGDWNTASGGVITNANNIAFPTASGAWSEITHFAIFDAASGGNMLAHGQFTVSKSVTTDDTPVLIAGDVNVSLD